MHMGSIHETHSTTIFLNENYKDQSTLVNWRERERECHLEADF